MTGLARQILVTTMLIGAISSPTYQLHNYGIGSGGLGNGSSATYSANGITGQVGGADATGTTYTSKTGNNQTQQANVPPAPTFTNPSSYYNKLHFVIITASNPTDTKFAIAISSDNFVTTQYIHNDDTVTSSFNSATDYQTYAAWGGAGGQDVIGLSPSTSYKIKVRAMQGKYTETQFGPTATAATVAPSITFDIDVSPTDVSTNPPYTTSFGSLLPATVTNTTDKIWVSLDTNAVSGAKVYLSSAQAGLRSATRSTTIASATADLTATNLGYGAQSQSATQTSGGPLAATSPFGSAAQNVGVVGTTLAEIYSSSVPITAGRASFYMKAKAAAQTPAAPDYTDTLTLVASAAF